MELIYNKEIINAELEKSGDAYLLKTSGLAPLLKTDEESLPLELTEASKNEFIVKLNGGRYNVYAAEDEKRIYVNIEGKAFYFEKPAEEEKDFDAAAEAGQDREEIKPPMPGSIVKVLVNKGDKVKEGDPLIIVEAMKMETSLYASIDGTVTEINAEAGKQADSEDVLIVVEKEVDE